MKRLLKPNGYLSALFGPIWSCYKGHHIWAITPNKVFTFNDNIIPPWGHLFHSKEEMQELLKEKFPIEVINALPTVYEKTMINHLFFEDYKNIIDNSGLKIIEFRDWHKPVVPDEKALKLLEEKYGKRNFSTISLKILLQK